MRFIATIEFDEANLAKARQYANALGEVTSVVAKDYDASWLPETMRAALVPAFQHYPDERLAPVFGGRTFVSDGRGAFLALGECGGRLIPPHDAAKGMRKPAGRETPVKLRAEKGRVTPAGTLAVKVGGCCFDAHYVRAIRTLFPKSTVTVCGDPKKRNHQLRAYEEGKLVAVVMGLVSP